MGAREYMLGCTVYQVCSDGTPAGCVMSREALSPIQLGCGGGSLELRFSLSLSLTLSAIGIYRFRRGLHLSNRAERRDG